MARRFFGSFASLFLTKKTPHHPTSSDTDDEEEESLKDKLFHLDLNEKSVEFVMEQGQNFLDYPDELAERLSIKVSVAKEALDELKAYKISQISKVEIENFEVAQRKIHRKV